MILAVLCVYKLCLIFERHLSLSDFIYFNPKIKKKIAEYHDVMTIFFFSLINIVG